MLAFVCAAALACVSAVNPGANAGIALQALTDAKDHFTNIVFEDLVHVVLPEISFTFGTFSNVVLDMRAPPTEEDVTLSFDEGAN